MYQVWQKCDRLNKKHICRKCQTIYHMAVHPSACKVERPDMKEIIEQVNEKGYLKTQVVHCLKNEILFHHHSILLS